MAAAQPFASAMPPAAITGSLMARTTCGSSPKVPSCFVRSCGEKCPRCPARFEPLGNDRVGAMRFEPQRLVDVVADASTFAPQPRT
jgi:hypothetical protein